MPISRAARATRTAISPRLAISRRSIKVRGSTNDALRRSRKARKPSWPSAATRCCAIACVVIARESSYELSSTRRTSSLAALTAVGPAVSSSANTAIDRGVEIRHGTTSCTRPIASARRGVEALAGQEERARVRRADLRQHEGRDDRRNDAELDFGEAENRVVGGDRDVADGGQPGAPAQAPRRGSRR